MDGRCKDCKWWERPDEKRGPGECRHVIDGTGVQSQNFAYAPGGEGYLVTGAEFGCTHFEAKDS